MVFKVRTALELLQRSVDLPELLKLGLGIGNFLNAAPNVLGVVEHMAGVTVDGIIEFRRMCASDRRTNLVSTLVSCLCE